MKKVPAFWFYAIVPVIIFAFFGYLISRGDLEILNPHGAVAFGESRIIELELALAAIIGVIVVSLTFFMAFRFRKSNKKEHKSNWVASKKMMLVWWLIPAVVIFFLAIMNWKTAHEFDPYKHIASDQKPILVQVVALRWKWLFIYPDEHIATINYLKIPVDTPIDFELTSDGPMDSFWIPELGGQIYSMSAMETQLNLMATDVGNYQGGGAEMSGAGFSGMNFTVHSVTRKDYDTWVSQMQNTKLKMDMDTYRKLREPTSDVPPDFYFDSDQNLYNEILMEYMKPGANMKDMSM